ncbi:hypothetical protein Fmac_022393 [Flemingia macrophylla]|uniref:Uncharacterized protein n=1 Tax=Flemingia macrophylla TaxID=520843 RepID=A0ABD1LZT0_9FABA
MSNSTTALLQIHLRDCTFKVKKLDFGFQANTDKESRVNGNKNKEFLAHSVQQFALKDNEVLSILELLKEAEEVTVRSLECLLLFVSDSNGQSKQRRWPTISKMMQPDRMTCDSQEPVK